MDDSPPPFIIFRAPVAQRPLVAPDAYQLSLRLVAAVHEVCETVAGRYPLKKQLEKQSMQIVMALARAKLAPRRESWHAYRNAQTLAVDVAAMLDILGAQTPDDTITRAGEHIRDLLRRLEPLSSGH